MFKYTIKSVIDDNNKTIINAYTSCIFAIYNKLLLHIGCECGT